MTVGVFCVIAGLFVAAGYKAVMWPKVVVILGFVLLIVGGIASAIASRRRPAKG